MSLFIHKDLTACVKSEQDLFLVSPLQTATKSGHFIEYHSLANIRDGGLVEFSIFNNSEEYIYLSASHLHVKVKIIKSDESGSVKRQKLQLFEVTITLLFFDEVSYIMLIHSQNSF